ncbi:AAA family ATPase [Paeniglutamicibacter psychrophenolicus]|uniref:Cellulose biosynthesis protein BcsQ n=1 Tax=Paeniglutamicibacter psychrophenolicus TaxID=257454 RepID=A0ABS4WE70_9MICC|nr:ParA family protein [Paeniglutamicibacter psychrophenolicus]MBP2374510.1 cellulose biosynthesis protein BcsQ [Paeniglutamicibacter psychrophenolicus]
MKALTFFNNKGGVGKTTLAVNMAYYLSKNHKKKILFVDCDPQCNATQILLPESTWKDVYESHEESEKRTILKTINNLRRGNSEIDKELPTIRSHRFGVDVLAGHPFLSLLEDTLSESWANFAGGQIGAAARTHWARSLVDSADYDLVIFDVGPSLGALNRSILIGSDAFLTPVAPDLFSLYSFDNLSTWFEKWGKTYARGIAAMLDENSITEINSLGLPIEASQNIIFAGYTTQEYLTKYTEGKARSVQAYDRYKNEIPSKAEALASHLGSSGHPLDLGVVPYMFSMVPLAQSAHAPIFSLTSRDGLNGAQFSQQRRYSEKLAEIGDNIAHSLNLNFVEVSN